MKHHGTCKGLADDMPVTKPTHHPSECGSSVEGTFGPSISVITVTQGRNRRLLSAISSVWSQTFPDPLEHLLVFDYDSDAPPPLVTELVCPPGREVRSVVVRRPEDERGAYGHSRGSVYRRIARLFNLGARSARAPWITFLDDDNEFESTHLESLRRLAHAEKAPAVHSGRCVYWGDGSPYLDPVFPWAADHGEGLRIHALLRQRGTWVPRTNVLRDTVDVSAPTFRNSTVMTAADPTFLVDQNVWLLHRELVLRLPFPETFSEEEIAMNTCPDDKFLEVLVRNRIPIVNSGKPTVRYFLGGVSNRYERQRPTDTITGGAP